MPTKKTKLPRKYTEQQLREAVKTSKSITQVIELVGLKYCSEAHRSVKKFIKHFNLDTSHFTGSSWAKGRGRNGELLRNKIEDYLDGKRFATGYMIKVKLFKLGIKQRKCEECGITSWNGVPAPLEIDHINGNNKDHRLDNLRILCANCHALCPTNSGKNKALKRKMVAEVRLELTTPAV